MPSRMVGMNRQLQQMSVIRFMKRPWQVGPAAAGPGQQRETTQGEARQHAIRAGDLPAGGRGYGSSSMRSLLLCPG